MPVSSIDRVPVLTNSQERVQDNSADTSITPGAVLFDRQDQRVAPVAQTAVAISSPAAGSPLAATTDAAITFATSTGEAFSVRRMFVQNKSAVNVYVELDAAASAGSLLLYPGAWLSLDAPCNVLHVYPAAAVNLNGTADGNLVVKGWL